MTTFSCQLIPVRQMTRLVLIFCLSLGLSCGGSSLGGGDGDGDGDGDTGGSFQSGPVDIPVTIAKAAPAIDPSTIVFREGSNNLTVPPQIGKSRQAVSSGTLSGSLYDTSTEQTVCGYVSGALTFQETTSSGSFEFSGVTPPTAITLLVCSDENGDGAVDTGGNPLTAQISSAGRVTVVISNLVLTADSKMVLSSTNEVFFCANDSNGNPVIGKIPKPGEAPVVFATVSGCTNIRIRGVGSAGGPIYVDTSTDQIYSCNSAGSCSAIDSTLDDLAYARVSANGDVAYATDADGVKLSVNGSPVSFSTSDATVIYRVFDWKDAQTLLVVEALTTGGSNVIEKDVSTLTALVKGDPLPDFDFTSIIYPVFVDCNASGVCFGLCDDGTATENNQLCEIGSSSIAPLIDPVTSTEVCPSGNPVFELEAGTEAELIDPIGFRNRTSGELIYSGQTGLFPRCDPTNENHALFFCNESDTSQICSFRPDFDQLKTGIAAHLFNTGSRLIGNGECTSLSTSTGDAVGTVVNATSSVTVNLEASGNNGAFYPDGDSTCSGSSITQVTIATGEHTASFRYKPTSTGTVFVRARDSASVLTLGVTKVTVQ